MEKITKDHPLSKSEDILQTNIETLKKLFPTIVKEGKIDMKELEALLSDEIETADEYYRFNWAGKSDARRESNKPSTATLRPCKEESKNWDNTENVFIEGDNLEVLKLLQKSYSNKIKLIYIDPPYNKGKDFVYQDNYSDNLKNYLLKSGQINEEGNKISTNTESDGRFHSNWLNMIYPRLKLARNLLKEDGAIFISIDNKEVFNLKKVCDEIFGEENFVECIAWNKRIPKNDKGIGNIHEYILIYAQKFSSDYEFTMRKEGLEDIEELVQKLKKSKTPIPEAEKEIKILYKKKGYDRGITLYNSLSDEYRIWGKINMSWPNSDTFGPRYIVSHPISKKPMKIPQRGWRWKEDTFKEAAKIVNGTYNEIIELHDGTFLCGRIWFDKDENTQPSSINYLDEVDTFLLRSILSSKSDGGIEVEELFEGKSFFSYPKPTTLIQLLINSMKMESNDIVLDFFAGSGTTANAVMQLNSEDGLNRKYICVQFPEPTDEKSEAHKAGFLNISEITKERIRRSGNKIISSLQTRLNEDKKKTASQLQFDTNSLSKNNLTTESLLEKLDTGFKSFKLDTSNINAWDGSLINFEKNLLNSETNIKIDRTEDDVLFEVLLKYGLNLTVPIEEKTIAGCKVYSVGLGALFVCLADNITTQVAEDIGKWKEKLNPTSCRVLFKDNGFKDDVAKTNSVQILKRFAIQEINSL
ncbi:MAG: site-specific DNA-methyltransferase [Bacteroidota bacterium]